MEPQFTLASLFAGVGGFDLAAERAGIRVAWQSEIDANASAVLRKHWPDTPNHGDITRINGAEVEPVDIITGGFPCQDLSVAGRRAGLAGERSGLYFEIVRLVDEMREATDGRFPTFVVLENVPGLLSSHGGRDFAVVLRELRQLGALDIGWRVLDAQFFGVPQRRRRVFVVADFGGQRAAEILFELESGGGDSAPCRETRAELAVDVAASIRSRGSGTGTRIDNETGLVAHSIRSSRRGTDDPDRLTYVPIAAPLTAGSNPNSNAAVRRREDDENLVAFAQNQRDDNGIAGALAAEPGMKQQTYVTHSLTSGGHDAGEDGTRRGTPLATYSLGSHAGAADATVSNKSHASGGPSGMGIQREVSHSLKAGRTQSIAGPMAVRRLTPRECERLQGFPDDHTRFGADGAEMSDSARYRMCGNAVAVPVVAWLLERIVSVRERVSEAA